MTKAARCPAGLGPAGGRLWREIAAEVAADGLELDRRELELLRNAAAEADMLAKIEAGLVDQPATVTGAQGQLVAHPLLGEARRSRNAIASLLKQLALAAATEPVGKGGRTTSAQARAAAMTRHLP